MSRSGAIVVADRAVAPVIPPVMLADRGQESRRPRGGALRRSLFPLPVLPTSRAGTMVYGLAALDSSGRIADRTGRPCPRMGAGHAAAHPRGLRSDRRPVGPAGRFFLNMGASYSVSGLRYLPRQDGGSGAVNGRIGQYEVYVSTDGTNWGTAVATGAFANDASRRTSGTPRRPGSTCDCVP